MLITFLTNHVRAMKSKVFGGREWLIQDSDFNQTLSPFDPPIIAPRNVPKYPFTPDDKSNPVFIRPSLAPFYLYVKPANSPKKTRVLFLFMHPHVSLLDDTQMTMLPLDADYYIDGRFLRCVSQDSIISMSIKSKVDYVNKIASSDCATRCYPFLLSLLAAGKLPGVNLMNLHFFEQVFYHTEMLALISRLPTSMLPNDVLEAIVKASDPFLTSFVDKILDGYYHPGILDEMAYNQFPVLHLTTVLHLDGKFTNFFNEFVASQDLLSAARLFSQLQLDTRSRMVFCIHSAHIMQAFPDKETQLKVLGGLFFRACFSGSSRTKSERLIYTLFTLDSLKKSIRRVVEKSLLELMKQPIDFYPPDTSHYVQDGLVSLAHFIVTVINDLARIAAENPFPNVF